MPQNRRPVVLQIIFEAGAGERRLLQISIYQLPIFYPKNQHVVFQQGQTNQGNMVLLTTVQT